jgi:type I restriction enzyme S subunit
VSDFPDAWQLATLSELCSKIVDGSHNPPKATEKGFPMLSARNIQDRQINFDVFRFISEEDFAIEDARTRVEPGDVLLTIVGTIGRIAIVPANTQKFTLQRSVAVLRPILVDPRYFAYAMESPHLQKCLADNAKGTAQKGIYLKSLSRVEIPISPLNEQKRIADKLDVILARVNACRERLDRVPAILKRFRQAVLAAATSGKLTNGWREEHGEFDAWQERRIEDVTTKVGSGATPRGGEQSYKTNGIPLIRSMNVVFFGFKRDGMAYLDESQAHDLRHVEVKGKDVLLNITGASIGRVTLAPQELEGARVNQHVCIIRPTMELLPEFLCWFLSAPTMQRVIGAENYGVTRQALTKQQILDFQVPVPKLAEQHEIVRRVDALFSYADRLEARYKDACVHVEHLTPALLAKAFCGELVPRDPNDEPASELLNRIRAERLKELSKIQRPIRLSIAHVRAPREKAAMTKSRNDEDVKYKPYLADLLRRTGGNAEVEELFKRADLPVSDFYKQLAWEIDNGHIRDDASKLEAA